MKRSGGLEYKSSKRSADSRLSQALAHAKRDLRNHFVSKNREIDEDFFNSAGTPRLLRWG